jgi:type IV pilus assembly protein PilB
VWRHGSEAERTLGEATLVADREAADRAPATAVSGVEDAPVVRFVTQLLARAVGERASDVHMEPTGGALRVRFRVDGLLRDDMTVPRSLQANVVSRIKLMSEIDIGDRRAPQDGRCTVEVGDRSVDLRVVSFPTTNGEALVLRLLDKSGVLQRISELGFRPETLAQYEESYRKPSGTILVTGPTGSGKSTTLYATLCEINEPYRNIITVEDPVEYAVDGVKQVQVNRRAGLTFASVLRSMLRADPDVVMVGEIRDQETARIAVEAALTGHLVLSSLHTKTAASAPARLIDMGVEPFLVTSAVECVVGQRLARRLCDRCKEPYRPAEDDLARAGWIVAGLPAIAGDAEPKLHRPVGCARCGHTGYSGRFAIQEVLTVTEEVARLVMDRSTATEVEALAVEQGMVPMRMDGLQKAVDGMTSLEELVRVVA